MRETVPIFKLYKTILLIAIVIGPIYWLMFTSDGKSRTDTMVLWLAGGESMDLNFKALDRHFAENDWKTVYKNLEWQCRESQSDFGQRLCVAEIASYNGIPSRYISVFFNEAGTSAVKLGYRDQYHDEIGQDLLLQLGQPLNATVAADSSSNPILQWKTDYGQLLLKKNLERNEEPVLLWLSKTFNS